MTTMYEMLRNVAAMGLSRGDVVPLDELLDEAGLKTYLERRLAVRLGAEDIEVEEGAEIDEIDEIEEAEDGEEDV